MKIVTFWGGLGNQIFEYAYYVWLKEKYPNEKIYGYYLFVLDIFMLVDIHIYSCGYQ